MGRFERSWALLRAAWRMLVADKRLAVFPLISGLALLVVLALFAVPVLVALHGLPHHLDPAHLPPQAYIVTFVFYFVSYLVIFFFNAALIACVLRQIDGGQPSLRYGLAFAWQRLPQIIGWALLASSVGILLRMLEDKVGLIGKFVVGLLGMAWSVTSFLVVPVLVAEGAGPIDSYKRSVALLKQSWGEQIIGNVSFGLIFLLFGMLPAMILVFLAALGGATSFFAVGALMLVWLVLVGLVQATLQTIYQASLYVYAATGSAPGGFDNQLLAEAFRAKKARRWF